MYIYVHMLLISWHEKFSRESCGENQNSHFKINIFFLIVPFMR